MAVRLDQNTFHNVTEGCRRRALNKKAQASCDLFMCQCLQVTGVSENQTHAKFHRKIGDGPVTDARVSSQALATPEGSQGPVGNPPLGKGKWRALPLGLMGPVLQVVVVRGRLRGRPWSSSVLAGKAFSWQPFDTDSASATQAPTNALYLMSVVGGRLRGRPLSSSVLAVKAFSSQTF